MKRAGGFTLFEVLVVLFLFSMLLGISAGFFYDTFRGQAVREGANLVSMVLAQARERAARDRTGIIVKLANEDAQGGARIDLFRDADRSRSWTPSDRPIVQGSYRMAAGCRFSDSSARRFYPEWILVSPSGTLTFPRGYPAVSGRDFDAAFASTHPPALGDIVLEAAGTGEKCCLDLDPATAKVRRREVLAGR